MTQSHPRARTVRASALAVAVTSVLVLAACATVEKTAAEEHINAGDVAEFNIVLGGEDPVTGSPEPAPFVVLEDELPEGFLWDITGDTASCEVEGEREGETPGFEDVSGTLECTYFEVDPEDPPMLTLTTETTEEDCGIIENTATVTQDPSAFPVGAVDAWAADNGVSPDEHNPSPTPDEDPSDSTATIEVLCPTPSPTPTATTAPTGTATAAPTGTPAETRTATPRPTRSAGALPDTSQGSMPGQIAAILTGAMFLGSLGALVVMNRSDRRAR